MGVRDHKEKAKKNVKCAVITVSSTRIKEDDESGRIISSILETNGHKIIYYNILKDDKDIEIYGPKDPTKRGGLISFNLQGIHPHDCATILNDFFITSLHSLNSFSVFITLNILQVYLKKTRDSRL